MIIIMIKMMQLHTYRNVLVNIYVCKYIYGKLREHAFLKYRFLSRSFVHSFINVVSYIAYTKAHSKDSTHHNHAMEEARITKANAQEEVNFSSN